MEGKTKVKKSNIANKSADYQMRIDRRMERRPDDTKIYMYIDIARTFIAFAQSLKRASRVWPTYTYPPKSVYYDI